VVLRGIARGRLSRSTPFLHDSDAGDVDHVDYLHTVEIASTRTLNRWPRNSGLAAISRMAIPSAYSFLWLRGIANSSGLQPGNERTVPAVGIYATGLPAPIRRSPQQGGRGIGAPQGLSWLVACLGSPAAENPGQTPRR
jgi:hypothetical protein